MSQPQLTFNSVFFRSMLNVTWLSSPLLPRLLAECESQKRLGCPSSSVLLGDVVHQTEPETSISPANAYEFLYWAQTSTTNHCNSSSTFRYFPRGMKNVWEC